MAGTNIKNVILCDVATDYRARQIIYFKTSFSSSELALSHFETKQGTVLVY